MEIVEVGHPALRERAREVAGDEIAAPAFQAFVDDLIAAKRAAGGAGLAANQVADLRRVAICEVEPDHPRYPYKPPLPLTVMINPVLERVGDETITVNEGCLSVPDLRGEVERFARVRVSYLDREGHAREQEFRGLSAGTAQHEVDHLDGVLFLDRVADPRTLTTWANFDAEGFAERARAITQRHGS